MKVYAVPGTAGAGSDAYRLILPLDQLRQHGHECYTPKPEPMRKRTDEWGREVVDVMQVFSTETHMDGDVYVFQLSLSAATLEIMRLVREAGAKAVVDVDDLVWDVPVYNPGRAQMAPARRREHVSLMLRQADLITCSTPYLADEIRRYVAVTAPTAPLRNRLWGEQWQDVKPRERGDRIRVGWTGVLSYRAGDLGVLRGVIGPWLEQNPDVDFVAAGDPRVHGYLGIPESQRVTVPAVSFVDLPRLMQFDVGLVPLADNPFNHAKSCLKGMEYAAAGIPFVASPTPEYEWWQSMSAGGLLARRPQAWRDALDDLVRNDTARAELGRNARAAALTHTIENGVSEWEAAYQSLVLEEATA